MTDAAVSDPRDAAIDAFLGLVADKGYGGVALRDVAEATGLGLAALYGLFRDKPALVAAFLGRVDRTVLAGTAVGLDPEETTRDRLFDVMMRRYDALRPYRTAVAAVHRAARRDPALALALAPALRRSMAAMLEAAAVPSDGIPGAVRQMGLLAVHEAVSRVFENDDSADLSKTMAALDGRLKRAENWAQRLEKFTQTKSDTSPAPDSNAPAP